MVTEKILVVDGDTGIFETVLHLFPEDHFQVSYAATGEQALVKAHEEGPGLILLDLGLPDDDGMSVCRELKKHPFTSEIPVVMLTTQSEEAEIVAGLELGAEYITKPFSPRVLGARIRAILRKKRKSLHTDRTVVQAGEVVIDPARFQVWLGESNVQLTVGEFKILHLLAKNRGWVYSREQIIASIKGEDYPVTDRSVDVQIVGLRKKLGSFGHLIETVRGVGYRFRDLKATTGY
jgi:two-component system, OmpR family, alkaline phosphatase synthesis response regulator PhoP